MSYIGLDSNYRAYDISEKQSYEREIAYAEDIIIGDAIGDFDKNSGITELGIRHFAKVFENTSYKPVSSAIAEGLSENDTKLKRVLLGCTSQAYGNTMHFRFAYHDNFSVGYQSLYMDSLKNEQHAVDYTDVYGEVDKLKVQLINSTGQKLQGRGNQESNSDSVGLCSALPYYPEFALLKDVSLIDIDEYPLIVKKDSREQLAINLMLCARSNRNSIVIGSALCDRNPLVSRTTRQVRVWMTFGRKEGDNFVAITQPLPAKKSIYLDGGIQKAEYVCKIPKAIVEETGQCAVSISIVEKVTGSDQNSQITSGIIVFEINKSLSGTEYEGVDETAATYIQNQIYQLETQMLICESQIDNLLLPPDNSEANLEGDPTVSITDDGRFKFAYLKGQRGLTGAAGANAFVEWGINEPGRVYNVEWRKS